jgi:hypothetical protein
MSGGHPHLTIVEALSSSYSRRRKALRQAQGERGKMRHQLQAHPDHPSGAIEAVSVEIEPVLGGGLWLRYRVDALLQHIALPGPVHSGRANGLWKTTCFELFVRCLESNGYAEFNFSPSSQWAAYRFIAYRENMSDLALDVPPTLGLDASEDHLALEVEAVLVDEWRGCRLQVGLSAVIEQSDGAKSFWALNHPPGAPDFHHRDCFALELPAATDA